MAKRSSSSLSSSSMLGTALKLVNPSYYLRKPHRLGFLFLFIVLLLFIGVDRQYSSRELEVCSDAWGSGFWFLGSGFRSGCRTSRVLGIARMWHRKQAASRSCRVACRCSSMFGEGLKQM